jgi:hypothetical protein
MLIEMLIHDMQRQSIVKIAAFVRAQEHYSRSLGTNPKRLRIPIPIQWRNKRRSAPRTLIQEEPACSALTRPELGQDFDRLIVPVGGAGAANPQTARDRFVAKFFRRRPSHLQVLRRRFAEEVVDIGKSNSQVMPVMVNNDSRVLAVAEKIQDRGLFLNPVTFPAVPKHKSRLRISVSAAHTEADLEAAVQTIAGALREEGICR